MGTARPRRKELTRGERVGLAGTSGPDVPRFPGVPYRLPRAPTSFVGRDREIAAIRDLLLDEGVHALTLVGPPGIGKTRLALAVADAVRGEFEDGAVFVDLSVVRDPGLVPHAIAQTVRVATPSDTPVIQLLTTFLHGWQLLLVLDNFEHIVEARAVVARLLEAVEGLKVLVTSREVLHLSWERQFPVPPLEVPPLALLPAVEDLARYASVALFVERARARRPDFSLMRENARAVTEICVRLDGLPLPIEMAAAQVRTLSPEAIARRLDRGLTLLAADVRDVPDRHQTMRTAVAWSYDLLNHEEQAAFRRLSVFSGGCTLEAAQAVYGGPTDDVSTFVDRLASLVDRSLLQQKVDVEGTPRFWMLESIREYGREQLDVEGEQREIRSRHAAFFLDLAQRAEPELHRREQQVWMNRLEAEHANFRGALGWLLEAGDVGRAARLASALHWFWFLRGDISEGRGWLARVLASREQLPEPVLARALTAAGMLAWSQGDRGGAGRLLDEAVDLLRRLDARWELAYALHFWGHTLGGQGDQHAAAAAFEESARLFSEVADDWGVAFSLNCLGLPIFRLGEDERAVRLFEDSQGRLRRIGDRYVLGRSLHMLADVLAERGEFTRAVALLEEGVGFYRQHGDRWGLVRTLRVLADIALRRGGFLHALPLCKEALVYARDLGLTDVATWALAALARIAAILGQMERAARLLGASHVLGREDLPPLLRILRQETADAARGALGEEGFVASRRAGELLILEEAVEEALSVEPPQQEEAVAARHSGPLSSREQEVANLVAQGLSNREIGQTLFIGRRTVDTHLQNILNKLDFHRRAEIAAWVGRQGNP